LLILHTFSGVERCSKGSAKAEIYRKEDRCMTKKTKKPWKKPQVLSTFTEEQLVQQKDALTFLGDWLKIIWGQG
jgi:hypothetical protein